MKSISMAGFLSKNNMSYKSICVGCDTRKGVESTKLIPVQIPKNTCLVKIVSGSNS